MNEYNANMYLTPQILNDIENEIEEKTNEVQFYLFEEETSSLQNIQVGDNLNSKTLYLSLPRNASDDIETSTIITTDNSYEIALENDDTTITAFVYYRNKKYIFYQKIASDFNITANVIRFKLPHDFGTVTEIDTTNPIYPYIKIYNNEMLIPDYEKHVWNDNEVLSMQKIDNIETAIKNIGYYYYKPTGWLGGREWLKTCKINDYNSGTNIQNISYQDLNRWVNNLSLINFEDVFDKTFWNTNLTQIQWNGRTNVEWEEY